MNARAVAVIVVATIAACGAAKRAPLAPSGDERDDGAGELAQAARKFQTSDDATPGFAEPRATRSYDYDGYGGDPYGGDPYGGFGGDPYGGAGYANWRMPQWSYNVPNRMPRYSVSVGLSGAIEGTVSWSGQLPPKLASACGAIDNPTLRVSKDKAMRGVIVYIERVTVGRNTPYYSRPASVGGMLAKHGCTLGPAAQIVAPLPGSVSINGDTQRTKLRIGKTIQDLQEGGLVQVEIKAGVTKIESEDGKLAAAWVLGLDTPYYAITDDDGRFRLDELAPGSYELTFWQPPIASINRDGTWTYGQPIIVKRSVKVVGKTTRISVSMTSH
ncbi:MAG TPA: hypothetical protein VIV40_33565 [Kofleriaceae bacterium]